VTATLERNLKLIPIHEALASSMVSLPIFVLFTRDNFGVSGALQIASLTYLFIVLLEVPSGWMSDWLGRVPTLSVAAAASVVGQACFLLGGDRFAVIIVGQFFVSAGYAFISGTDVSFHFDSLEALGRGAEYAQRQARVSGLSYMTRAGSAIVGGLLGLVDLRLAFAVALVVALATFAVTRMFYEPPSGEVHADPFVSQIGQCLKYLRDGFMAWLFFYGIALVVLEHVAVTLVQPWLTEALGKQPDDLGATPLLSGVMFAVVAFVGALAARGSATAGERFGTVAVLVALGIISAAIVTGMALSYSLLVLALILFRSVQGAAAPVLISAAVAPRTQQHHRATLLSLNSLAGRLAYGALLLRVSFDIDDDPQPFLRLTSVISWVLVALLLATGRWASRRE
jgi:MFS family permease